ncbi:autotransporter-associated beta strand repeat-containing protein [Rariglobus hedericola]
MNPSSRLCRSRVSRVVLSTTLLLSLASVSRAADGTWATTSTGLLWSTAGNWSGSVIADGSGFTANFNNVDIPATPVTTVNLDSTRTIGNLVFGDTNTATAGSWVLSNNGNAANALTLAGTTPTITVDTLGTGATATISAVIAGSSGLTKAGLGTLVLSGANTFSGTTNVNAGTLRLASDTAIGNADIASGAVLNVDSVSVVYSGNTSGAGRITKTNSGSTLTLLGNGLHSGGTTLTDGRLILGTGTNNGLGTGTFTLSRGAVQSLDNSTRTITNALSMGSNELSFGALQGASTGLGDLNFASTTGTTIGGSKIWTVTNSTTATFANNWSGNTGWSITKAGTGTLVFSGNMNTSGALTVNAGAMTLNGLTNSYTGVTTVSGGILLINGAKTGTGAVTITSGTFGGNGTIAGAATAASGSFLSPGASSGVAGTLTFTSTLDISGLASGTGGLLFNLGSVGSSDKIALSSGALTIGTGALDWNDFSFTTLSGYGVGTYTLFSTTTSIVGTMGSNLTGTVGGLNGTLSISGNDIVLTVSAIPEPSTYALIGGVLSLGLAATLRRKRL